MDDEAKRSGGTLGGMTEQEQSLEQMMQMQAQMMQGMLPMNEQMSKNVSNANGGLKPVRSMIIGQFGTLFMV